MAEITQANFQSEFMAFYKRNIDPNDTETGKRKRMTGYVMIRPDHCSDVLQQPAFRKWCEYLVDRGITKTLETWINILRSGKPVMVPCDDPNKFELSYIPMHPPAIPDALWPWLNSNIWPWKSSRTSKFNHFPGKRDDEPNPVIVEGFRNLKMNLGKYACVPANCPKQFGLACPNRGTGVCRATDEADFPVNRDWRQARFVQKTIAWSDPAYQRTLDQKADEAARAHKSVPLDQIDPNEPLPKLSPSALGIFNRQPGTLLPLDDQNDDGEF